MPRFLPFAAVCMTFLASAAHAGDDTAYRAGIGFLNKGLHDLAATQLESYLKDSPDGKDVANARYALGVCLVRQQKFQLAAEQLEQVGEITGFPFAADARLLLAQCDLAAGAIKPAVERLTALTSDFPQFASLDSAYQLLGEAHYRDGHFPESRSASQVVLDRWPKSPSAERASLLIAMSLAGEGKTTEAAEAARKLRAGASGSIAASAALLEAQCRQSLGEAAPAGKLFESAAAQGDPSVRCEALLGLAQSARQAREFSRAKTALDKLLAQPLDASLQERATLELGRLQLDNGSTNDAARTFAALAERASPAIADDAGYWSAKCSIKSGALEDAATRLEALQSSHGESELAPLIRFDLAWVLARLGQDQKSRAALQEWLRRYPTHNLAPDAALALAACEHRLGEYDDSLRSCEAFLKTAPDHPRAPEALLLTSENLFMLKRFDRAERRYAEFVELYPKDGHAWRANIRRGLCLIEMQKPDEGVRVLSAAIDAPVGDTALRIAALSALGELALSRQQWPQAAKWFDALAALTTDPTLRAEAVFRQGLAVARAGRADEAAVLLRAAAAASSGTTQAIHANFELAQALLSLEKLDEAKSLFDGVIAAEKNEPAPQFTVHATRHLASIASRQGRHDDAAALLARMPSTGEDPVTLLEQGTAYLSAGNCDLSEKALSEYLSREPGGARVNEAKARRAIAIGRQDRHDECLREIDSAIRAGGLDAELTATLRYERALTLRLLGRVEDSAKAYRELLATPLPPQLEAYGCLDLAQLEIDAQHYEPALTLLDRSRSAADRASPASVASVATRAGYFKGVCQLRSGKAADAAATLAALAGMPDLGDLEPMVTLVRGESLLVAGRAAEAAELLKSLADTDRPDIASPALLRLGEATAACQQWSRSEQAYSRYLDRFKDAPQWYQAQFGLAWAMENQGRHDAAIESYRAITARHEGPTAARAQFQIGECLYAQKKHESAAAELLKVDVLYAYPEWSAAALYEAGRCLADFGRTEEAARQHDDLIARFPDSSWSRLAKERRNAAAPADLPGKKPAQTTTR